MQLGTNTSFLPLRKGMLNIVHCPLLKNKQNEIKGVDLWGVGGQMRWSLHHFTSNNPTPCLNNPANLARIRVARTGFNWPDRMTCSIAGTLAGGSVTLWVRVGGAWCARMSVVNVQTS